MNDLYIVANFGEMFLKGKNISFFETKLFNNLKENLGSLFQYLEFKKKKGGVFYILLDKNIKEGDILKVENIIKNTPGFSSFYRAYFTDSNLEGLKNVVRKLIQREVKKNKKIKTFAISSERGEKTAKINSKETNIEVGSAAWEEFQKQGVDVSVDLNNPDITFYIKIKKDISFVFIKKQEAVGGLPVGSTGKAVVFFSGGIDSPVACFMAQKRGLEVIAVHFHSVPKTTQKSIEKVKQLVSKLTKFQTNIKLYLIPIISVQEDIVKNAKRNLSVILQRRAFLHIGEKVLNNENAMAFVTGDSLGQVASQTLENLTTVSEASDNIILRPLIGLDKIEIIKIAKKINTFEISQLPHEDSCSLFVPKNPETRSKIKFTKIEEDKLNHELIDDVFSDAEILNIKNNEN